MKQIDASSLVDPVRRIYDWLRTIESSAVVKPGAIRLMTVPIYRELLKDVVQAIETHDRSSDTVLRILAQYVELSRYFAPLKLEGGAAVPQLPFSEQDTKDGNDNGRKRKE